jgi:hypothetical protein
VAVGARVARASRDSIKNKMLASLWSTHIFYLFLYLRPRD